MKQFLAMGDRSAPEYSRKDRGGSEVELLSTRRCILEVNNRAPFRILFTVVCSLEFYSPDRVYFISCEAGKSEMCHGTRVARGAIPGNILPSTSCADRNKTGESTAPVREVLLRFSRNC